MHFSKVGRLTSGRNFTNSLLANHSPLSGNFNLVSLSLEEQISAIKDAQKLEEETQRPRETHRGKTKKYIERPE